MITAAAMVTRAMPSNPHRENRAGLGRPSGGFMAWLDHGPAAREMEMACYAGLDASKSTTKICVLDALGAIIKEGVVDSDPKAIVGFLRGAGWRYRRVGMESWSLAPWLYAGLAKAGLPIICIEAGHSSAMLKAKRSNKTDKNDARGIAEIMRAGIYKSVHIKSVESQHIRSLLTVRKFLRTRATDTEIVIGATLLVYGHKLRLSGRATLEQRVRKVVGANAFLASLIEPLLAVRKRTLEEVEAFEQRLKTIAADDPVCRRLMTAPGVGPLVALTYRSAIDEPRRFRSRNVGAHLGLTPRVNQSGMRDAKGRISKHGDAAARTALVMAARQQLRKAGRPSWFKEWANAVAARRGAMKALIAVARRLAVILHRMWLTETDFRWTRQLETGVVV